MNIIFEGLDNVGKTTQIMNIIEHFNKNVFHIIHCVGLKNQKPEEAIKYHKREYKSLFSLMKDTKRNFIFDRMHLGEMVYGKIYRNYEAGYIFDIENSYINLIPKLYLIVLVDEPEGALKREDGLSFSKVKKTKQYEKERFELAFKKSKIKNKILINIKDKDEKKVFKEILKFLKK